MGKVLLVHYGGVVQKFLAELLLKRRKEVDGFVGENDSIPPRDFFNHLITCPLPEVVNDGEISLKANIVIRFINQTDDILNLKRGLLYLLELGGNTGHFPFPRERYDPDLLEME